MNSNNIFKEMLPRVQLLRLYLMVPLTSVTSERSCTVMTFNLFMFLNNRKKAKSLPIHIHKELTDSLRLILVDIPFFV